jgi:hypothetical protein
MIKVLHQFTHVEVCASKERAEGVFLALFEAQFNVHLKFSFDHQSKMFALRILLTFKLLISFKTNIAKLKLALLSPYLLTMHEKLEETVWFEEVHSILLKSAPAFTDVNEIKTAVKIQRSVFVNMLMGTVEDSEQFYIYFGKSATRMCKRCLSEFIQPSTLTVFKRFNLQVSLMLIAFISAAWLQWTFVLF